MGTSKKGITVALGCALAALAMTATADAAFPGENGPVAFQRIVGPGQVEIFAAEPDGSNPRNLTASGDFSAEPAFAPDGTMIAFTRDFDIWVMNADGSGQRNVTNDPGNGAPTDGDPVFTPDGQRIIYSRDTNDQGIDDEIFSIGVDGSNPVNLTNNGIDQDATPAISPDGTKIAWARDATGPSLLDEIFVMDSDGSNPVNVTNFGVDLATNSPDFSPDGSHIVFAHDGDLWQMRADGSEQENLTPGPFLDGAQPAYSPDGTRIAFARDTGGAGSIDEIFSLGEGPLVNISNAPEDDARPAWGVLPALDTTPPETILTKKMPAPGRGFSRAGAGDSCHVCH